MEFGTSVSTISKIEKRGIPKIGDSMVISFFLNFLFTCEVNSSKTLWMYCVWLIILFDRLYNTIELLFRLSLLEEIIFRFEYLWNYLFIEKYLELLDRSIEISCYELIIDCLWRNSVIFRITGWLEVPVFPV